MICTTNLLYEAKTYPASKIIEGPGKFLTDTAVLADHWQIGLVAHILGSEALTEKIAHSLSSGRQTSW